MAHTHERILAEVSDERLRQEALKLAGRFTHTCADAMPDGARVAVLGEEFGEVCRAVLESGTAGTTSQDVHGKALRAELVQVAAVAIAWIEGLDREAEAEASRRWS